MSEEEKKAIEIVMDFAITHINDFESEDDFKYIDIAKNLIETQKAELKKKDKMIDKMAENLTSPIHNKKEVIEYFTRLVEGEKKDG